MKTLLLTLFLSISIVGLSQESLTKTTELQGITPEIRAQLQNSVTLDCTMIYSSKSFSLDGRNIAAFCHFIDQKTPVSTVVRPDGFLSFMDNQGDVIDTKFFFGENGHSYIEVEVEGRSYYNALTQQGADFFNKFKQ